MAQKFCFFLQGATKQSILATALRREAHGESGRLAEETAAAATMVEGLDLTGGESERNVYFAMPFYALKMTIILPRQARVRRREKRSEEVSKMDLPGGAAAAETIVERWWSLFLEQSTLRNFDRIFPVRKRTIIFFFPLSFRKRWSCTKTGSGHDRLIKANSSQKTFIDSCSSKRPFIHLFIIDSCDAGCQRSVWASQLRWLDRRGPGGLRVNHRAMRGTRSRCGAEKAFLRIRHMCTKKRSFYQDRLGTYRKS